MKKEIRLSRKHGLNPSLVQCFFCMKDKEIALFGELRDDVEAPRQVCLGQSYPCSKCEGYMKQGIIVISFDPDRTDDMKNPWRSGGWAVVREEAIERWLDDESLLNDIRTKRFLFIEDEAWNKIGLPR